MHDEKPDAYRLDLHLPEQHFCLFSESTPLEAVRQKAAQKKTSLLALFDANNNDLSDEDREKHGLTYVDYPLTHTFRDGIWTKRKERASCWTYRLHSSRSWRNLLPSMATVHLQEFPVL
jgi:hypothetical protein